MDEEARRREAMELLRQGVAISEICRRLGRTRQWLGKWRRRVAAEPKAGLRDRSRAPRRSPRATAERTVRAVLAARDRLAARRGRQRFAGIGADAVAWELTLARVRPQPALRTIERILQRSGRTAPAARPPRPPAGLAGYPAPRAERPGDLQQTDMVGPRHLRTAGGPRRFFSFHTVDVAGGGAATWQATDKSAESFCRYLLIAWARLGLPRLWQVDNEAALAGFPLAGRVFTQPVRLALLLGVAVRFIPKGEPGRNADIESFNRLWQDRVLHRFTTPGLPELARVSGRFERWFMLERPHPKLTAQIHGTRFPGALLASLDGALPRLPRTFTLERYRDGAGELRLPLARGRISWVRRAGEDGSLEVIDHRLRLGRKAANEYVVATLSTARAELTVSLDGRVIGRYRHPIAENVIRPIVDGR